MDWIAIPQTYVRNKKDIQLVELKGISFCLVWLENRWIAFAKKCPHAGANLANGWCEGHEVVCPFHRHRFNLLDGRGAAGQGNFITIYPLKEESETLYIGLRETLWSRLFGKI